MHFHPKVTIVIPVHNGSDHLDEAIDSALAQTYRDIEVIIVDGSSSKSGLAEAITRSYGDSVKHIGQAEGGLAGALNAAITCMTGDVFTWMSHGELHLPNKVAAQVSYWNEIGKRDAVLVSDADLIDENGRVVDTQRWPYDRFVRSPMLLFMLGCVNSCTIFIPVNILKEVGPFDISLVYTYDYELWNRVLSRYEIFHQPEALVAHRSDFGSGSRKLGEVVEANALWMRLIDERSEIERVQMSGSSFRFYSEMAEWLGNTTIRYAADYARLRAAETKKGAFVSVILAATSAIGNPLAAALSVLEQTHRNLELLIVVDTDTRGALEPLARDDPRVRLLDCPSSEPERNRGLEEARGDYVAFLDPQDCFLPEKIEVQVAAMQEAGSLFCHTSSQIRFPECFDRLGLLSCDLFRGVVYPDILIHCPIVTSTVMINRLLAINGFRFNANATAGLDRLTWIWTAMRHPLLGVDNALTVATWLKRDAPVNGVKSLASLRRARKLIESDFCHAQQTAALAQLRTVETDLRKAVSIARAKVQLGSVLDEGVIETAFAL